MMKLETLSIENQNTLKKSVYPLYAIFAFIIFSSCIFIPGLIVFIPLHLSLPVILVLAIAIFAGNGFWVYVIKTRKELVRKDLQENIKEVHTGTITKTKRTNSNNQLHLFTIDGVDFFVPVATYNTAEDGDQYRIEKAKYSQGVIFAIEKITV